MAAVSEKLKDLRQFFQHVLVLYKWQILKTIILAREAWPQESPLKQRGIVQCDVNKDQSLSAGK